MRRISRVRSLVLVALALMLVLPWAAGADNVHVVVSSGADSIKVGESTQVSYYVQATSGDDIKGCNCTATTPVTVSLQIPQGVVANPSTLTFTNCDAKQYVTFTASSIGDFQITASADGPGGPGAYNTEPAKFTLHVLPASDTQPPVIICPQDITAEATGPDGAVVTFEVTATDNVEVASLVVNPPSGSTFPLGTTTVTATATDTSGNSAACQFAVTVQDTTPPEITCPGDITAYATGASQAVVTFAATAYDLVSGNVPVVFSHASGSSFPVGTTMVTATATDEAGNTSSCTFKVTVLYNWSGFFAPVDNLPVWNRVKAGSAVPVKFRLGGDQGLNVFAAAYPKSGAGQCNSAALLADIEQTVTAGQSSLTYDAIADQYVYVWKTDKAWAGTCRQLVVKLADGTEHMANFAFTK